MYIYSACICIYNTVLRCGVKYVATVSTWFQHVNYRQFLVVSLPMNLQRVLHFTIVKLHFHFRCYQKGKLNDGNSFRYKYLRECNTKKNVKVDNSSCRMKFQVFMGWQSNYKWINRMISAIAKITLNSRFTSRQSILGAQNMFSFLYFIGHDVKSSIYFMEHLTL